MCTFGSDSHIMFHTVNTDAVVVFVQWNNVKSCLNWQHRLNDQSFAFRFHRNSCYTVTVHKHHASKSERSPCTTACSTCISFLQWWLCVGNKPRADWCRSPSASVQDEQEKEKEKELPRITQIEPNNTARPRMSLCMTFIFWISLFN